MARRALSLWAVLVAVSCDSGRIETPPARDAASPVSDAATVPGDGAFPSADAALPASDASSQPPDGSTAGPDAASACAGHCGNGVLDCGETGQDCGGECTACPDPCAGHCRNGSQDCGETGKDCGGECAACVDPCAGHCGSGAQDCGETGQDCGGECTPCGGGTDDATLVGHTLPSQMGCGADATATVTLKNSGTTTWFRSGTNGYKLGYVGDTSAPFLPSGAAPRAQFPEGVTVAPGASVTFDVALRSPSSPGTYAAEFQMLLETVHWFGAVARRDIAVSCTSAPCSFPQGVPEADFIESASSYQDTDPAVDAAVNAAMASLTGCGVGSSCDLSGYAGANADEKCQSWFAAVTQSLRDQGYCAGQHIVGATDEIAVSNTGCTGKWYGYHVCNYGGPLVVWNPGARRGWWKITPSHCP